MSSKSGKRKGVLIPPSRVPPSGFVPFTASNESLRAYGLPPCPIKEIFPQRYAQWERLMSRPLSFVAPEHIVDKKDTTDPPVDASIHQGPTASRAQSQTWSGAVNNLLKCGDKFQHIEASWSVPGVYPTPDKWETIMTWDNDPSKYTCGIWVGIDGYHTSHDVLQAGTGLRCTVNQDGTLQQETFAWFEWYPDDFIRFTKFKVQAGDIITVMVDFDGPSSTKDATYAAHAVFVNESNSTYTTFTYMYEVQSKDRDFKGDTAEWILEGHKQTAMPNFGATFMYNCLATTANREERDLDYSKLIDMVRDNKRLSTPVKVTENIMGLYWGDGTLKAHRVDAN